MGIDFMKLAFLLEEFGIPFRKDCEEDTWKITLGYYGDAYQEVAGTEEWSHPKIDGYPGFYTQFIFDTNGKFLSVGAWE